ncbi:MAG TPA: iron dicitrate transport regulator FecR, partial [Porphyromonadaceae bacterium]|nr:iron dicitrate transport regulator FecR [Porphyromonadaceae bacterium]
MAIHKRSINSIIREQLTGELTEDDRKRLNAWIESSPENRVMYEQFMSATNFRKRYESYAE